MKYNKAFSYNLFTYCLPLSCWDNSTGLHFLTLNKAFLSTTTKVCWGFSFFINQIMLTAQALRISWCRLHGQDHVVQCSVVCLRLYWDAQDLLPSFLSTKYRCMEVTVKKEEKAGKRAYDFQFMKNHNNIVFLSFSNFFSLYIYFIEV